MRPPYTCLYREIWDDSRFYEMSEIGRLVYFYVLSSPMGNGLGCFKAGVAAMAEEMRLSTKRFIEGFKEGLNKGLYEYDELHRVLLVPKYFYRNPPANPNGIKALSKEFLKIPTCKLKTKCYHIIRAWIGRQKESFAEPFEELFAEPLEEPLLEQPGTISPSPSLSPSLSPSYSLSSNEDIYRSKKLTYPDDFLTFWASYPRKVGKGSALKAWVKAKENGLPDVQVLIDALAWQKETTQWLDEQYIPHPATWINQARWEDEPDRPLDADSKYPSKAELNRMMPGERHYWKNRMLIEGQENDQTDDF